MGNGFIGWVDLPANYDKEEFQRIKAAAAKIKSDTDVFTHVNSHISQNFHFFFV